MSKTTQPVFLKTHSHLPVDEARRNEEWVKAIKEMRSEKVSIRRPPLWDRISDMCDQTAYYDICINRK